MQVESDFIILGSGIAGLSLALKLARLGTVRVITKSSIHSGATKNAQGGIASVFSKNDSFDQHIQDTLSAGAGICDTQIVKEFVEEGPGRVQELIELGVPFTKNEKQEYDLTREGGHQNRRILHVDDFTGRALEEALIQNVRENSKISVHENCTAIDLITDKSTAPHERKCFGIYALENESLEKHTVHTFASKVTILATGGAGKVYLYTSNPDVCTGDGIAMAHRAGVLVANMEFMQFHPTCLFHPHSKSFLISEALRGEGGEIVDAHGNAFLKSYHPMGSLAPRDIVARAIDSEIKKSGAECMYLDMTHLDKEFLKNRFPNIYDICLQHGIDFTTQPIPIVPAAHYTCGGVMTNKSGETSIENLYAVGEVGYTGFHGANRLASNSLLEAVVVAHNTFDSITQKIKKNPKFLSQPETLSHPLPEWDSGLAVPIEEYINIQHTWKEIRTLMWNYVGIVRSERRLEKARARLQLISYEIQEYYWNYFVTKDLIELRNIVTVANLIVDSALMRKESRGLHFNLDYPAPNDQVFMRPTIL